MKSDEEKLVRDTFMQVDDMQNISRWRAFHSWLKGTEAWQRLVARKHRAKFFTWMCVIGGVLMWAQTLIDEHAPVLELDQLEKRSGILVGAGLAGKYQNEPWLSLRLRDGQVTRYRGVMGTTEQLTLLIGQPLTVWSQDELVLIRLGYDKQLKQIQSSSELIVRYSGAEQRAHMEKVRKTVSFAIPTRILPSLMVLLPLLGLWHLNRKPSGTTQPTKERE